MPSVFFIKIVIMTNLNRCDNHITMINYSYITIYNFYLNNKLFYVPDGEHLYTG